MKFAEALTLKKGDLVVLDHRNKFYGGLVLEVLTIKQENFNWCLRVTLKQPGFDSGFRINDYDSRHLIRYEP